MLSQEVQCSDHRAVRFITAAKFQCIEQMRQHAAIVVAVRSPHDSMNDAAKGRTCCLELLDEILERLQPDHRVERLLDGVLRMIDGRFCHTKQDAGLATYAAEIFQQLRFDLLLGLAVDLVDDLHQKINQAIDNFVLPLKTERGRQAIASVRGMSAQIPDRFNARPPTEFLQPFRWQRCQRCCRQRKFADRLQLGQFLQQGLETDAPGIAAQLRKTDLPFSRRRVCVLWSVVDIIVWRTQQAIKCGA